MKHAAIVALAVGLAAPPAGAITAPGVPPRLQPSALEEPAFMLSAEGVHIFECKPGGPTGFTWRFVAPAATLYEGARSAATQSAPDLWEAANDRSSVAGVARTVVDAAEGDLPWALYGAHGLAETGLFAGVTSIQRINTAGGVAPSESCSETDAGSELRVPFTADYYFYRRAGEG